MRLRAGGTAWEASADAWWRFARALDPARLRPHRSVFRPIAPEHSAAMPIHQTVRAMFLEGRHYRTTPQYEMMVQAVERKRRKRTWGCRSIAEVEAYFARLVAAFESMRTEGYLSQRELGGILADEIPVHIGRDGQPVRLLSSANHRFLMAEILGIRWVACVLRGVDPEWLERLCRESSLPPQEALSAWLAASRDFHAERPEPGSFGHVS
jgi:hypothetical protein